MAFSDARNERDRADTGRNSGNHGGRDNAGAERRNREAMARSRVGSGSFVGGTGLTRDKMRKQDQTGANVSKALNDQRGVGDSFMDRVGNMIAGAFGFNEMDPTRPGFSGPGRPGMTGQADWGFDPAGLIGGGLGMGFGIPLTGFVADQISSLMGRPLEMNMGPSVFGGSGLPGGAPQPGGGTGMANTGNLGQGMQPGGLMAPPQQAAPAPGAPAPNGMGQPQYPQFQWAQPWPGSQPQMGGPLSSWSMNYQPSQQAQQQPWSNGLMAPQQSPWGMRRTAHSTGWR